LRVFFSRFKALGLLLKRRSEQLDFDRDLQVVGNLHGRAHNQVLVTVLHLCLANDVQQTLVVQIVSLARQQVEVDVELVHMNCLLSLLDRDLEPDSVGFRLFEFKLVAPIGGPRLRQVLVAGRLHTGVRAIIFT
jgi:hypothetical protein